MLYMSLQVFFITIVTARMWRLWFLYSMSTENLWMHRRYRLHHTAAEKSLMTDTPTTKSSLAAPTKQVPNSPAGSPPLLPGLSAHAHSICLSRHLLSDTAVSDTGTLRSFRFKNAHRRLTRTPSSLIKELFSSSHHSLERLLNMKIYEHLCILEL